MTVIFALLSVETGDLLYAILSFCAMCITIGGFFWILGAPLVAMFQLLVYGGAVVALFIATIMLTTREECERLDR
jgi:NADH:ubiquinone oxidoreductase subunit 6 (subunit J)